jgi:UDP-GlcNAc:undecaprenyl-phosphate GlcNAc-1-phosphate transferase
MEARIYALSKVPYSAKQPRSRGAGKRMGAFTIGLACVGLALCWAICAFAEPLARRFGMLDRPDGQRKLHRRPTPLLGGAAVALPAVLLMLGEALASEFHALWLILSGLTGAFWLIGAHDDRRHIRPAVRLALSLALCLAALAATPALRVGFFEFSFVKPALFLDGWALGFTVVSLVGLQNAVNMADGSDGLALGMLLAWTLLIAVFAPAHILLVLLLLAASLAIALWFNLRGRLFLGDSGTYSLAVLVGLLAVHAQGVRFTELPTDMVALWFLIPVVDCLRVMLRRILAGRSPFAADRTHLHHVLWRMMPWRFGLPLYLSLILAPSLLALAEPRQTLLCGVLALSGYAILLGLGARFPAAEARQPSRA